MIEVDEFTNKFTDDKLSNVIKVQRNFFQVSDDLLKVKQQVKKEPFAIGTYIGSGKPFHPSAALLDWIGERTERYAVIDKKASWLFVCGRDLFVNSILIKNVNNGVVIVKNELNEVLGYGEFERRGAIKNLLDKGDFLRRERH